MKLPKYPTKIRGKYLKVSVQALNVIEIFKLHINDTYPEKPYHKIVSSSKAEEYDSSSDFRRQFLDLGYKILKLYPIYYQGWEGDQWGAIGEKNGKLYRLETSHGFPQATRYTGPRYAL